MGAWGQVGKEMMKGIAIGEAWNSANDIYDIYAPQVADSVNEYFDNILDQEYENMQHSMQESPDDWYFDYID